MTRIALVLAVLVAAAAGCGDDDDPPRQSSAPTPDVERNASPPPRGGAGGATDAPPKPLPAKKAPRKNAPAAKDKTEQSRSGAHSVGPNLGSDPREFDYLQGRTACQALTPAQIVEHYGARSRRPAELARAYGSSFPPGRRARATAGCREGLRASRPGATGDR